MLPPGNVSDSEPILKRIDRIKEPFNIKPKYLGLDAGYSTNPIFKGIIDRDIIPVVAYRRSSHKKGMYTKNKYIYDYDKDIYICPNNVALIYKEFFNKLKTTYNVSGSNFIWEFKGMGIILKNL